MVGCSCSFFLSLCCTFTRHNSRLSPIIPLEKALERLREKLDEGAHRKLIHAASVLTGIDALILCRDVCGPDKQGSSECLRRDLVMILKGQRRIDLAFVLA